MEKPKIIVALDFDEREKILKLVEKLRKYTSYFKIGFEAFMALGPEIISCLVNLNCKVFLDIKLFDIPTTMAKALKVAEKLKVFMVNLHLIAGKDILMNTLKIYKNLIEEKNTLIIGVTTLTSYANNDSFFEIINFKKILKHFQDTPNYNLIKSAYDMKNYRLVLTLYLSDLAKNINLDGVVCSVQESKYIKTYISKDLKTVCPGIRPVWASQDDQKVISTPAVAKENLVDFMVIGRPITNASDPEEAILKILEEISK